MREGSIRIPIFAAALALVAAGAAFAAGGVWVSDDGDRHEVGSHAIMIGEDGNFFDLSDLEDGETRVFGGGDMQITATRYGDTVTVDRPESGDGRALRVECRTGRDTCKVVTFGDDGEKVALMIQKRRAGHHVMTFDEDVMAGEDGEATITITRIDDCEEDDESGCGGAVIELLDDSALPGEMLVEVVESGDRGDVSENIWITTDGPHHGHHAMMVTDGATKHDLSDLYDGETRIFGSGERQVTAVREGDEVRIVRPGNGKDDDSQVRCVIGRDVCQVLTYDDDPEKVAVVIMKSAGCGPDGDCLDGDALGIRRIKIVTDTDD